MKKINLMLVMGIVISSIITTNCNAQLFAAKSTEESSVPNKITSAESKEAAKAAKAATKLNKANIRALKGFNEDFKNEQNVNWFNGTEVISASFKKDDIQTTVCYNKKGSWLRTMKVYTEDHMPADVRNLVKRSEYSNYSIPVVQEFKEGDLVFYVVHLEDSKTYKQICVCNGEINLYSQFNKQL